MNLRFLVIVSLLSFSFLSSFSQSEVLKREEICPRIGKSNTHHNPASAILSVHIPLRAEIKSIKAYLANCPWGNGESDYSPTTFTETPLIDYNGQSYREWGGGWARAFFVERKTNDRSQWVTVKFESWKHDNSRSAKLEVEYYYP